jgi:hypothetical protein
MNMPTVYDGLYCSHLENSDAAVGCMNIWIHDLSNYCDNIHFQNSLPLKPHSYS